MAILFLAAASTVNSLLMVRMTNEAREKAKQNLRYLWVYFVILALGWFDIIISLWAIRVVLQHVQ